MIAKLASLIHRRWDRYREWDRRRAFRRAVAWAGRRALSYEEYRAISGRLAARWTVGSGLWDPLGGESVPADAFVADARAFHQEVGAAAVRRILASRGVDRVFELDELGGGYAFGLDRVLASDNHFDRYWTSDGADWLIHVSHEETVAFAGAWLVGAIREVWPDWSQHLWWT